MPRSANHVRRCTRRRQISACVALPADGGTKSTAAFIAPTRQPEWMPSPRLRLRTRPHSKRVGPSWTATPAPRRRPNAHVLSVLTPIAEALIHLRHPVTRSDCLTRRNSRPMRHARLPPEPRMARDRYQISVDGLSMDFGKGVVGQSSGKRWVGRGGPVVAAVAAVAAATPAIPAAAPGSMSPNRSTTRRRTSASISSAGTNAIARAATARPSSRCRSCMADSECLGQMERFDKETVNAGEKRLAQEHETLTERIIGAAIEVHRCLGPGFRCVSEFRGRSLRVSGLSILERQGPERISVFGTYFI